MLISFLFRQINQKPINMLMEELALKKLAFKCLVSNETSDVSHQRLMPDYTLLS